MTELFDIVAFDANKVWTYQFFIAPSIDVRRRADVGLTLRGHAAPLDRPNPPKRPLDARVERCYSFSTFLFYFFFPPSTNVPIESVSRSGCSFFLANTSSPVPRVPHRARRPYFRRLYSSVPGIISCPPSAVRVRSPVVQSALTTTSYLFLFRFLSSVPGTRPSPAYRPTRPFRRRGVAIRVRLPLSEHPNRSRTVCVVPRVVTKGVSENRFSDRYRKNIRIDSKTISEQR